jgi:hypothetical protein
MPTTAGSAAVTPMSGERKLARKFADVQARFSANPTFAGCGHFVC